MRIIVIASGSQKEEWLSKGTTPSSTIEWMEDIRPVPGTDGCIDLLFDGSEQRLQQLAGLAAPVVIVNEVVKTLDQLPGIHARINGWPGFLERPVTEASAWDENKPSAEKILTAFNTHVEWVTDMPGMVSPRIISMIINEAYHALDEQVSSKEEIDTAMKLGTNYPFGPFTWSQKIGLKNVYGLLDILAHQNNRYTASSLLKKEAAV